MHLCLCFIADETWLLQDTFQPLQIIVLEFTSGRHLHVDDLHSFCRDLNWKRNSWKTHEAWESETGWWVRPKPVYKLKANQTRRTCYVWSELWDYQVQLFDCTVLCLFALLVIVQAHPWSWLFLRLPSFIKYPPLSYNSTKFETFCLKISLVW